MPTYTYRREDGSTFEIEQRISEDPLEACPTTGQPVKRIITAGAGLVFKGSGFYLTDYSRSPDGPGGEKKSEQRESASASGDGADEKATVDDPGAAGSSDEKTSGKSSAGSSSESSAD